MRPDDYTITVWTACEAIVEERWTIRVAPEVALAVCAGERSVAEVLDDDETSVLRVENLEVHSEGTRSFRRMEIVQPERLRDIASNLMSESRVSQKSVTDQDIIALPVTDAKALLEHLGRMGRDRPVELGRAVVAILRVATLKGDTATATAVLQTVPAKDVKAPVVLLFGKDHVTTYRAVLERWAAGTPDQHVKNAVSNALNPKESGR